MICSQTILGRDMLLLQMLCPQFFAAAQLPQYHVQMLTDHQGLNTANIMSMVKDKKGFLWLLSESSVQRNGGKDAKKFPFSETLEEIFVDSKDRKWVIGRKGVYLYFHKNPGSIWNTGRWLN